MTENNVTLREHVDQRIDLLERMLDARAVSVKMALDLQAAETERRLGLLNGAAERLHTIQATYYTRELADLAMADVHKRLDTIEKAMIAQEARGKIISAVISGGIGLAIAFGGKLIH